MEVDTHTAGGPAKPPVQHYVGYGADSSYWDGFEHRDDDVVICTPPKCGTTWTQMLVAQLFFDGDVPAPLGVLSPWVDMLIRRREDVVAQLAAQSHRRFPKTHVPLDGLPFDDRVTYVVVARDPRDVWLSFLDHFANLDLAVLMETLGPPPEMPEGHPDPSVDPAGAFLADIAAPVRFNQTSARPADVLHHLQTAWERRGLPNVHLFHYADLVRDLTGELRHLASALGVDTSDADLERYTAAADLDAMRAGAERNAPESDQIWQDPAAFFKRGRMEQWREVFTPEVLTAYDARSAELHTDEEFLAWAHGGRGGNGAWRGSAWR